MEHLAILKRSWNLTQKILDGKKTIESRWYTTKKAPYDRIKTGDIVYFKETGGPVCIRAEVCGVKQFSDLNEEKVMRIYKDYPGIFPSDLEESVKMNSKKRYCVLIFLKNPKSIKPFEIDKSGYGIMSAWICINKIDDIKKK